MSKIQSRSQLSDGSFSKWVTMSYVGPLTYLMEDLGWKEVELRSDGVLIQYRFEPEPIVDIVEKTYWTVRYESNKGWYEYDSQRHETEELARKYADLVYKKVPRDLMIAKHEMVERITHFSL